MPSTAAPMLELMGTQLNSEKDAREVIEIGTRLMTYMGWDDELFRGTKNMKHSIDINAALFCFIQATRSSMPSWNRGAFVSIDSKNAMDISDRRNLKKLISPETSLETINVLEWMKWKNIHVRYESNPLGFAMLMTRTAMASSIIRFLRDIFKDVLPYDPVDAAKFKESYDQLAAFSRYHRGRVRLQNKEADKIKNVVNGTFLHLGDIHSLLRFHPDYAVVMNSAVVANIMLHTDRLDIWKTCCGTLKLSPDSIEKELKQLPSTAAQTLMLLYIYQYVYATTSNRVDLYKYSVFWHEWMSREILVRLLDEPNTCLSKTPILCCMGTDSFWLVYHDKKAFLAENSIHALTIWLDVVKNKHGSRLDNTSPMISLPPADFVAKLEEVRGDVEQLMKNESVLRRPVRMEDPNGLLSGPVARTREEEKKTEVVASVAENVERKSGVDEGPSAPIELKYADRPEVLEVAVAPAASTPSEPVTTDTYTVNRAKASSGLSKKLTLSGRRL